MPYAQFLDKNPTNLFIFLSIGMVIPTTKINSKTPKYLTAFQGPSQKNITGVNYEHRLIRKNIKADHT